MAPRIDWGEDEIAVIGANLQRSAKEIVKLLPIKPGRPVRSESAVARKQSMMLAGEYSTKPEPSGWSARDAEQAKSWGNVFCMIRPKKK